MGYICERHHPCENKRSGTSFTGYRGGDYIIQAPGYFSANDAKGQSLTISWIFDFDEISTSNPTTKDFKFVESL